MTDLGANAQHLGEVMLDLMYAHEGIGLAAPQIGLSQRCFVLDMRLKSDKDAFNFTLDGRAAPLSLIMPLTVINPLLKTSGPPINFHEGCLSLPDVPRTNIQRASEVSLHFQDNDGHTHLLCCDGFFARVILHEFDHLEGILFIDHLEEADKLKVESSLQALEEAFETG